MNAILTFEQTLEYVADDDIGKWDAVVPRADIRMREGLLTVPRECLPGNPPDREPPSSTLAPSPWALSQLCRRLGIPTAYFRRCPTPLQDVQANHWLQHVLEETKSRPPELEPWLLRVKGGSLRAVLSERYAALDNIHLLHSLTPFLERRLQVGWFALTDDSLHLRFIDYRMGREVLPDDRLFVGVHISNSEVGKRSVTVDAIVYRLLCENGLIRLVHGKSLLHQRHIYLSQTRFVGALETAVREALTVAAGFLEQLSWATRTPLRDAEAALKSLTTRWNLPQVLADQVRVSLLSERPSQQETVYGLVNALTHAAQRLAPDDRYDLEALAGKFLESGLDRDRRDRGGLRLHPGGLSETEEEREVLDLCA